MFHIHREGYTPHFIALLILGAMNTVIQVLAAPEWFSSSCLLISVVYLFSILPLFKRMLSFLFTSPINAFMNRFSVSGDADNMQHHFKNNSDAPPAITFRRNGRTSIVIENIATGPIMYRLFDGFWSNQKKKIARIVKPAKAEQLYGFMRLGARVDLFSPLRIVVKKIVGIRTFDSATVRVELS